MSSEILISQSGSVQGIEIIPEWRLVPLVMRRLNNSDVFLWTAESMFLPYQYLVLLRQVAYHGGQMVETTQDGSVKFKFKSKRGCLYVGQGLKWIQHSMDTHGAMFIQLDTDVSTFKTVAATSKDFLTHARSAWTDERILDFFQTALLTRLVFILNECKAFEGDERFKFLPNPITPASLIAMRKLLSDEELVRATLNLNEHNRIIRFSCVGTVVAASPGALMGQAGQA